MESTQSKKSASPERGWSGTIGPAPIYVPALDGLRALAIVLVLLRHALYLYNQQVTEPITIVIFGHDWSGVFLNGWIGVDLFFVLSGFLIARPFLVANYRIDLKTYVQKRLLRIVPAYVFVIFLIVIGVFPFYYFYEDLLGWQLIIHALFLQDYFGSYLNVVMWSLGVEEKFYLLLPAVFWLITKIKKAWAPLIVLGGLIFLAPVLRYLIYIGFNSPTEYETFFYLVRSPFHANLEPLFLGVAIAFCRQRQILLATPKRVFLIASLGLVGLLGYGPMLSEITVYDAVLQPTLIAFVMAGLVYSVVFGYTHWALTNKLSIFLAKISYSLYLLHWPLFPVIFFSNTWLGQSVGLGMYVSFLTFCTLFIGISVAVATVQFRMIEQPFLSLKKYLK